MTQGILTKSEFSEISTPNFLSHSEIGSYHEDPRVAGSLTVAMHSSTTGFRNPATGIICGSTSVSFRHTAHNGSLDRERYPRFYYTESFNSDNNTTTVKCCVHSMSGKITTGAGSGTRNRCKTLPHDDCWSHQ